MCSEPRTCPSSACSGLGWGCLLNLYLEGVQNQLVVFSSFFFFFSLLCLKPALQKQHLQLGLQALDARGAGHLLLGTEEPCHQPWGQSHAWKVSRARARLCAREQQPSPNTLCCSGRSLMLPLLERLSRCLWLPKAQLISNSQEAGMGRKDHCLTL